jgi:RimJ/RimL family protein N-acetyltransferase
VKLHELAHVRELLVAPSAEDVERARETGKIEQFVVEKDGQPVGMAMFVQLEPWLVELGRMIAQHPGDGMGTFVLRWVARNVFDDRRAHRLYLEVHARNVRARSLYERFGFVHEGTYRDGAQNPATKEFEDLCIYGMLENEYRRLPTHFET